MSILLEGHNCWVKQPARRVAFLVDAASYFSAFVDVALQARHTIRILGWDTESAVDLVPDPDDPRHPTRLGDFLETLLTRQPSLTVHILTWDFSVIYALEREALSLLKFQWMANPRLHFRMDGVHPIGASHHQKVVVVDDALAFVGGIDLCRRRWDTTAHLPHDTRRVDPRGLHYPPFHDVQAMVEGPVAARLGALFQERWTRATDEPLAPSPARTDPLWPSGVHADMENVPVAVVRGIPPYKEDPGVKEVEQLYVDTITRARRSIYLENQYFSSWVVAQALEESLRRPDGPEVVMVLPCHASGWLERGSMEVFVARQLKRLREADIHGRFAAFHPANNVQVHSKVSVVDDEIIRVGSANLSNRSLGLDTECDLCMEEDGSGRVRAGARELLVRLLSEHMAVEPSVFKEEWERTGSVLKAVSQSVQRGGNLQPFCPDIPAWQDRLAVEPEVADPEMPLEREQLVALFAPKEIKRSVRVRDLLLLTGLVALVALTITWRWTPLKDWVDINTLEAGAQVLRGYRVMAPLILPVIVVASLVMVPITALNFTAVLVFGPAWGFIYAVAGSMLAALASYAVGRWLSPQLLERLTRGRLGRIRHRLLARGALTILAVRIFPVAPFTLINLVAGASRVHVRDYMVGTFLGMTPGIMVMVMLRHGMESALLNPGFATHALLMGMAALVVLLVAWAHHRMRGTGG